MTRPAPLDEMVDGRGGLRSHWRGVLGAFAAIGDDELVERAQRLDQAFEEDGVSSILPGTSAAEHTWRCDPVPLPIAAAEFAELEAGLSQRARLMSAILDDFYGPQHLLAEGALPPALVFANPGFLRPCRGPFPGRHLHVYAADLMRGPDGAWRVLADRTMDAGGIGYARENRRVLARVLPEAFRPVQVRQLRPFFDIWQDALRGLAPEGRENPVIALLTPGTDAPQWFEHMSLSRELSCALVEGGDLTVRSGALFLKTLKGLQRVDVLLRRMDGRLVDPLELDGSSVSGVPGLLDAARGGAVRIANDPGAGLVEAPALAAFLPALCELLLGEKLALPCVPTIWLGEEKSRARLQHDPSRWLIRPAHDGQARGLAPAIMEPAERMALMQRVSARPWEWAATAAMPPSVAPSFVDGRLKPLPIVLRVFLVFDGTSWQAMQGGLARVGGAGEHLDSALRSGGVSKDVWVLSEDSADIVGPAMLIVPPLQLRRTSGDLPSRVADDLFWLGRYVERLEAAARLVRACVARLIRGAALLPRETAELRTLVRCLTESGLVPEEALGAASGSGLADLLFVTLREGRQQGAIAAMFAAVSRLTESVRDRLTGDMYATFTQTLRAARAGTARVEGDLDALALAMVGVQRFCLAVAGVAAENMVRGGGFLFLDLGRRLERAQAGATELACALDQTPAHMETGLRLALELCDSVITYRSRYLNVLQPAPVLDLVLADQGNPRGLAFQLVAMHRLLGELAGASGGGDLAGIPGAVLADAEALVSTVLAASDQNEAAVAAASCLRSIASALAGLSDGISRRYFALLPAVQSLGWGGESPA
jgi:uncharacterized circularly permuted ATP-grasp superfamily protein/uncharacterized alpha-E superfamily protein